MTTATSTRLITSDASGLNDVCEWYDGWATSIPQTTVVSAGAGNTAARSILDQWDRKVRLLCSQALCATALIGGVVATRHVSASEFQRADTIVLTSVTVGRALEAAPVQAAEAEGSAVGAIDDLSARLNLPLQRVLKAAGVVHRTYYSWRDNPGIRPRVGSLGRLWSLGQCVQDLEQTLGDVRAWIADPSRLALLEGGAFNELVDLAVASKRGPLAASDVMAELPDDSIMPRRLVSTSRPVGSPVRMAGRD